MDKKKKYKLKKEIMQLKNSLNELNVQKERWFSRKENLKKDISNLIGVIRIVKLRRDKSTEEIKQLRERRDNYNKEVQTLIKRFRGLNKNKEKILKDKKIRFNPSDIIKKIEKLEFKIETEGFPFEKEQTIMKQIKQFKKQLEEAGEVQSLFKELKELSDEITDKKRMADEIHRKIRETSSLHGGYSEFLELTKKINALRKEQEEAFKKFIESKEKFSKVNERLKIKLTQAKDLGEEIVLKNKRDIEKALEKRTKEVEDKLRDKKKLTTDDLMIYQKSQSGPDKSSS